MIILGLHFGHDASVSIIEDGEVLVCLERERINRIKHAISLDANDVKMALEDCDLSIEDIDYCSVTSTQYMEMFFLDQNQMSLEYEAMDGKHKYPCYLTDNNIPKEEISKLLLSNLGNVLTNQQNTHYHQWFGNNDTTCVTNNDSLSNMECFIEPLLWRKYKKTSQIESIDYSSLMNENLRMGFHYPITLKIFGIKVPGYCFSHHMAHAAYAFYESPYKESAIFTADGGGGKEGYIGSMFYYGKGNKIYSLVSPNINIGPLYKSVSVDLGLGSSGGPGKLMGLAPYGKPKFFDKKFVGNYYDIEESLRDTKSWMNHCIDMAKKMGYDLKNLGNSDQIMDPINVDIAASTQKLFEEIVLNSVYSFKKLLLKSGLESVNLSYAGGCALNCPANTKISNESPFENLFIPPAVDDGGLSIGSALALYYNVMGHDRRVKKLSPKIAYLGLNNSCKEDLVKSTLEKFQDRVSFTRIDNISHQAAKDLNDNKVITLFYGRSEVGPRALGHRSILSNPKFVDNWERVNAIKTREKWRPFAPIVLESEIDKYFTNCQFPSYFMLMNAMVKSNDIPAITHVDNSARVQSVNKDCGIIYQILEEFQNSGNAPILMNTSFNGPAEPIVETPEHAIEFLLSTKIDALYFENYKVERL